MPIIVWQNSRFGGANYGTIDYGAAYVGNLLSKAVPGDPPSAPPNTADTYLTLSGVIDGVNAAFTTNLVPTSTLQLYRNGAQLSPGAGLDYTLSGNIVTFQAGQIPKPGDVLIGIALLGTLYMPISGTINGVNAVFTLSGPVTFLLLWRNGILQNPGMGTPGDYSLAGDGRTITFNAGSIPHTGDILLAKVQTT